MPIKVLIADDFQLLREDLCEVLSAEEDILVVGQAASGAQIVQLAETTDFDVILMDIEMETTTAGIRATETILQMKPDAVIVFLTAHETDEMILLSMAAGAADYIVKGCSDEDVLRHLRMAAKGEAQLESRIQQTVLKEYSRLQRSEQSLFFFINMVSQLTPAERALVRCLLDDKKIREIAQIRCVEVVTVKTQIKSLLRKFGCSRTKEIVQQVRQLKLDHLF